MPFALSIKKFSGPLEALLELVEARKLEIAEISLAEVTGDFLRHVEFLKKDGEVDHGLLADFIVVASRLILIKSKSLLPDFSLTPEEEGEIQELEERLKFYRACKPLFKALGDRWRRGHWALGRPYFLNTQFLRAGGPGAVPTIFYPGKTLAVPLLHEALQGVFAGLRAFQVETQTLEQSIVSLEEKIQEIARRIEETGRASFESLAREKSKGEIVALFLALLHLARDEGILLAQESHFSDIIIERAKGPRRNDAR